MLEMYRVFENGKRCDEHNIPGWVGKDTFSLKRNAEVYAYMWAYPVTASEAEANAKEMDIGVDYNMFMSEFPILMRIEVV
jgi:hypothetical protein